MEPTTAPQHKKIEGESSYLITLVDVNVVNKTAIPKPNDDPATGAEKIEEYATTILPCLARPRLAAASTTELPIARTVIPKKIGEIENI